MPRPRRLTSHEVTWLASLGQMVRIAQRSDRQVAIGVVVHYATRLHDDGVTWRSITDALGASASTLRQWRRTAPPPLPPTPTPRRLSPLTSPSPPSGRQIRQVEPTPVAESARPPHSPMDWQLGRIVEFDTPTPAKSPDIGTPFSWPGPHTAPVIPLGPTRRVLVATGDAEPGSNRFDREAATIRQALELTAITVVERACVEPTEIARHLAEYRPAVLHLAAHTAYSAIGLAVQGTVQWVDQEDIGKIITQAHPPRLAVLNICSSRILAYNLISWCPSVLYWPDIVGDNQLRQFSNAFYRSLAFGQTVAFAAASSWPASGPAQPMSLGDESIRIF